MIGETVSENRSYSLLEQRLLNLTNCSGNQYWGRKTQAVIDDVLEA